MKTKKPTSRRDRVGLVVFAFLCVGVAIVSPLPYLLLGSSAQAWAEADGGLTEFYAEKSTFIRSTLMVHAAASGVALLLTPLQASTKLRRRVPVVHRVSGRVSALAIVVGAISAVIIAPGGYAGLSGAIGFSGLAIAWLYCLQRSISAARAKRLATHREWGLRVIALSFAAVTLRLWLGLYIGFAAAIGGLAPDQAFDQVYVTMPFVSWIPNLLIVEWYLRRNRSATAPQTAIADLGPVTVA